MSYNISQISYRGISETLSLINMSATCAVTVQSYEMFLNYNALIRDVAISFDKGL